MFIWTSYLSSIINNWEWTARFLEGIFKFCESIVRIGIGCYPPLFFLRDMTDFCRISKTCIGSLAKSERCDHSFTPPQKKTVLIDSVDTVHQVGPTYKLSEKSSLSQKTGYIYIYIIDYIVDIQSSARQLFCRWPCQQAPAQKVNRWWGGTWRRTTHSISHTTARIFELSLVNWNSNWFGDLARCLRLLKTVTVGTTFVLKELVMENKASREFMQACRMDPSIFGYIWFEKVWWSTVKLDPPQYMHPGVFLFPK